MQLTSSSCHKSGTANDSKRSAPQRTFTTKGLEPNRWHGYTNESKLHLFIHVYTLVRPIVTRVAFLLPNHSEYVHSFIKPDRQRWIYNYYSCYVDSRGEGWKFAFSLKSLKICLVPYRDEPLALIFTPLPWSNHTLDWHPIPLGSLPIRYLSCTRK